MRTPNRVDAERIVETHWPYDGPHSPETIQDAAKAIGQLVRYLANATQYNSALPYANAGYEVAGRLRDGVARLSQTLDQLAQHFDNQAGNASLYDDRGESASATAKTTVEALCEAKRHAGRLTEALRIAAGASSHLGNRD